MGSGPNVVGAPLEDLEVGLEANAVLTGVSFKMPFHIEDVDLPDTSGFWGRALSAW